MAYSDPEQTYSMRDLFDVLFRHKLKILIVFFAMFMTALAGVYVLPEKYEATASLLVKLGRENITIPTVSSSAQNQVVTMGLRKEDINTEIGLLHNRFIIEKTVQKLKTDFFYPAQERPKEFFKKMKYYLKQAVKQVRTQVYEFLYLMDLKKRLSPYEEAIIGIDKGLKVEQIKDSDVINITLRWFDPNIARITVDTLLSFYMEHHLEAHMASGGYEFLKAQVEITRSKLNEAEDELQNIEDQGNITVYEKQRKDLLEQLTSFIFSLKNTQSEILKAKAAIAELKNQMSSLLKSITPGFSLSYKEAERNLMLQEVELKSLEAERTKLVQHIESYRKELESLNTYKTKLRRLERQIRINEENYQLFRKKLEEARISEVLDAERIVNVKIIDPASGTFVPVRPRKLLITGAGFIVSLIFGISVAFLAEYLDHSIKTVEDVVAYIDLPVLATITERK